MTTNAGSDRAGALAGFGTGERKMEEARTEKALAQFLRPEFLNRVDEVITFRALEQEDFVRIAAIFMNELKSALEEKGIKLTFTEEALALIARESYSHKYGARNMRRYIQTHVEDALAEQIIADYTHSITNAKVSVKNGKLTVHTL